MQPTVRHKKPIPWHIAVFLAPAVLIYTVFMIYPLVGLAAAELLHPGST